MAIAASSIRAASHAIALDEDAPSAAAADLFAALAAFSEDQRLFTKSPLKARRASWAE